MKALVLAFGLLSASTSGAAAGDNDAKGDCLFKEAVAAARQDRPAVVLASEITEKCLELDPEVAKPCDPPIAPDRCRAIKDDYIAQSRSLMMDYAYRMIVSLRPH